MNAPQLLPCPFCACCATFGEVYERDDRRYMSRKAECSNCDACQRASIPFSEFSKMTAAAIEVRLTAEAAAKWNLRVVKEEELATANRCSRLPEIVSEP